MCHAHAQSTHIIREDNTRIYCTYDAAHRLSAEDWLDPSDAHIYALAYEYDAAGNRLRLKESLDTEVTYHDHNSLNKPTSEQALGREATHHSRTPPWTRVMPTVSLTAQVPQDRGALL